MVVSTCQTQCREGYMRSRARPPSPRQPKEDRGHPHPPRGGSLSLSCSRVRPSTLRHARQSSCQRIGRHWSIAARGLPVETGTKPGTAVELTLSPPPPAFLALAPPPRPFGDGLDRESRPGVEDPLM